MVINRMKIKMKIEINIYLIKVEKSVRKSPSLHNSLQIRKIHKISTN